MYPYKYGYGQYRVIFPSVSIWRLPVLWFLTKILLYAPIEEYNVYSLGNWAMPCWSTSDALSFPLNLQYNSLPIEKAARTPYSPQSMYLILSIFTLLFYNFNIVSWDYGRWKPRCYTRNCNNFIFVSCFYVWIRIRQPTNWTRFKCVYSDNETKSFAIGVICND